MTWLRTWWPELIVWLVALAIVGYFAWVVVNAFRIWA